MTSPHFSGLRRRGAPLCGSASRLANAFFGAQRMRCAARPPSRSNSIALDSVTSISTSMDYIDDLTQAKEVFALYGAAMYEAQCVEKQLAILGATKYNPEASVMDRGRYDVLINQLLKKTFGAIYQHIQMKSNDQIESRDFIEEALSVRNWLAHDYFWERAGYLPTSQGRQSMLSELRLIHDELKELDKVLSETFRVWGRERGITDEMINQLTDDLIRDPDQF